MPLRRRTRVGTLRPIASDDAQLVERARAGDRRSLETLLRRHHDRLYAVCRRLTASEADGADALQDALIAIVRGLPRFDGRAQFSTWSYRVAVNASLDELRARGRRAAGQCGVPEAFAGAAALDDAAEAVAVRVDVDAALRRLSPQLRAAVVLRDVCGLGYAEIAEILDVPPGTVRSRIARGRAALVPLLADPVPAGTAP